MQFMWKVVREDAEIEMQFMWKLVLGKAQFEKKHER